MGCRSGGGRLRVIDLRRRVAVAVACSVGASVLSACSAYDSGELASRKPRGEPPHSEDGGSADGGADAPETSAGRGGSGSTTRRDAAVADPDVPVADGSA